MSTDDTNTETLSSLPPAEPVAGITEDAELRELDQELLQDAGSASAAGEVGKYDRILYQAALFMIPTGLVLIVLGWYGASRTVFVFEQIPYVVSGGILGAALLITGGLLYVGVWIERVALQQRHQAEQMAELLALLRGDVQELTVTTAEAVRNNGNGSTSSAAKTAAGTRKRRKKSASGKSAKKG